MAADTTTMANVLQNVYAPDIRDWVNNKRPLSQRLDKVTDKTKFQGSKYIIAASTGRTQAVGSPGEGEALPTGGNEVLVNMEVAMKRHYAVVRITAELMAVASGGAGAFVNAFDQEIKGAKDELEEDLAWNRTHGAGHGDLAEVSTYTGTTLTLKDQPTTIGAMSTRYLRENMRVDSYTALSGGSQNANNILLGTVTGSTDTVTVPASAGFVAGDFVFRHNSRAGVTQGLAGIIDDGTLVATFQNLSRTAQPKLKANLLGNSAVLRAWTPELMDELSQESAENGNGKWPTAFYSQRAIQRRAAAYIRNDRRVDMPIMKLDNGYETVAWTTEDKGQTPWFTDFLCRSNTVYAVHEPDLAFAILTDIGWVNEDGSTLRVVDRTHTFEAWLHTRQNMFAYSCNSQSVLTDVSHTA